MSLILDALNKADREQNSQEGVPDIHTVHSGVGVTAIAQKPWLLMLSVSLALIVVFVVILLLKSRTAPVSEVATESVPANHASSSPSLIGTNHKDSEFPTQKAMEAIDLPQEQEVIAGKPSAEVMALYQTQVAPAEVIIEPNVQPAKIVQSSSSKPAKNTVDAELAQRLWRESNRPIPAYKSEKKVEPPASKTLDAPLEDTLAAYIEMPFLHELPVSFQNTIPTLMYALHEYPEGMVVINKKQYRNGAEIVGGVKIRKILADGVLAEFNNVEFKLAALNSWVNY